MNYVYIRSEPRLFTVGHYDPNGGFNAESDHEDRESAAARCAFLNGGASAVAAPSLTIRDQFAMAALTGLLADPDMECSDTRFAELAYGYADAMLYLRSV